MTDNRVRINNRQAEILVRYMEEYPKLASGGKSKDIIEPSTLKRQALWQMLVDELNSCGARKNALKWRKTWADMKRGIKEKVRQVQAQQSDSSISNNAFICKELTPFEERVYALTLPIEERATFQRYHTSSNDDSSPGEEFLLFDENSLKSEKQTSSEESQTNFKKLLLKIAPAPPKVSTTNSVNLSPDTYIVVNTQPKKPQAVPQVNSVIIVPEMKPCKVDASQQTGVKMSMIKSQKSAVKKRLSASPYAGALLQMKEEAVKARKEQAAAQFEMVEAQKELAVAYREVAAAQQELTESQNNLRCSFDKLTQVALKIAQRFV